jgi:hypothetical protein
MYFLFESILPDLIDDSCLTFCELLVGKPQHYEKVVHVAEEKYFAEALVFNIGQPVVPDRINSFYLTRDVKGCKKAFI